MTLLDLDRIERIIDAFRDVRLLVLGDVVLDEYVKGDVDRVSPEAPVPVVHVKDESAMLGGAANAARNVVALGGQVECCSVVGDDAAADAIRELMAARDIDSRGLVVAKGRPTTRKTRIVAQNQQLVRFDRETLEPLAESTSNELLAVIEASLARVHGVVVEDYGKGVLTPGMARALMKLCTERGIPVVLDPKSSLEGYLGASLVKPNLKEAEALTGLKADGETGLTGIARALQAAIGGGDVVITRGAKGMSIFEGQAAPVHVPTVAQEVFDVAGAGDTAIAALALSRRAEASLLEASIIANAASGVVVGKVGTAVATAAEVKELLPRAVKAAEERA